MSHIFCENCARPLAAENSICTHCDWQLSQRPFAFELSAPRNPLEGNKVCPYCHERFFTRQLRPLPHPANAPWYRLTSHKPSCPHCGGLLMSSRQSLRNPDNLLLLGLMLLAIPAAFWDSPWAFYLQIATLVASAAQNGITGARAERDVYEYQPFRPR